MKQKHLTIILPLLASLSDYSFIVWDTVMKDTDSSKLWYVIIIMIWYYGNKITLTIQAINGYSKITLAFCQQ